MNLSSGGAFLKTQMSLLPAAPVHLFVDWPMPGSVAAASPLMASIFAHVLRTSQVGTAIAIVRCDWVTRRA
jgi:hypothetical protein